MLGPCAMQLMIGALAALMLIGTFCVSGGAAQEGFSGNFSDITEHGGMIIKHIYELAPIWLALMLVVSAACELKSKKPIDEGAPWSAIGVAR